MTRLEELPARLDDLTLQVLQLRTEMRGEFSAIRAELAHQLGGLVTRTELADQLGHLATRRELADQIARLATRRELADQIASLATQMRVLHEDVVGRIALLQEGLSARPKRRPKRK